MRVVYKENYNIITPVLVKLHFGRKYLIEKFPDKEQLEDFVRAISVDGKPPDSTGMLESFNVACQYVLRNKIKVVTVEVILATRKAESLLIKERELLNRRDNTQTLNPEKEPPLPDWCRNSLSPIIRYGGFFKIKGRHRASAALIRLWAGTKYFIWKCKDIQEFESKFNSSFDLKLKKGCKAEDPFCILVNHVINNKIKTGTIEVLQKFSTRQVRSLLKAERKMLKLHIRKRACLNSTVIPYKPKWITDKIDKHDKIKNKNRKADQ